MPSPLVPPERLIVQKNPCQKEPMPPKGKGGKSKAGEAPPSGGEAKAFQTRSSKAGLQVCLVLASDHPSLPAHLLFEVGLVALRLSM